MQVKIKVTFYKDILIANLDCELRFNLLHYKIIGNGCVNICICACLFRACKDVTLQQTMKAYGKSSY